MLDPAGNPQYDKWVCKGIAHVSPEKSDQVIQAKFAVAKSGRIGGVGAPLSMLRLLRRLLGRRGRGWAVSALFHAVLLVLLAAVLVRSQPADTGVLIVSRFSQDAQLGELVTILEKPSPLEKASPEDTLPVSAPGVVWDDQAFASAESLLLPELLTAQPDQPSGGAANRQGAGNGDGLGKGTAGFFGVAAAGRPFVYVVDLSGSMAGRRFERARSELLRSIWRLEPSQRFYIIFFNNAAYPLFYPRRSRSLLRATIANKKRADRWVQMVMPQGDTYPAEAMELALSLNPDAIFLLSDGNFNPDLLLQVRRTNHSKVVIHTIGFEDPAGELVLRGLAVENGGIYRFVP